MLNVADFCFELQKNDIGFFCGVPDSLLKSFCAFINDNYPEDKNVITANEGNAIALASGYYLATGKIGCVYMQNSGLGNCVNPLLSLADKDVYGIPMLLIIGWRGEPNVKDEPQHIKQGQVTLSLLDAMEIEYRVLENMSDISTLVPLIKQNNKPYALVIRKGTFDTYTLKGGKSDCSDLSREDAIKCVVSRLNERDVIVSTTGMISRELYEIRDENKTGHQRDFLTVGSMGHASSIALGIALSKANRRIYCFDGDGAVLMHMGAPAVIASLKPTNFRHIMFNNQAHDSVGGQPTVAGNINFVGWAKSVGYIFAQAVDSLDSLNEVWDKFSHVMGPAFLEIKVKKGARSDLGRPKERPQENKALFMKFLEER